MLVSATQERAMQLTATSETWLPPMARALGGAGGAGTRPLRDFYPAAPLPATAYAPPPPQQQPPPQQEAPFAAPLPCSPVGSGRPSLAASDPGDWPRMSQLDEAMAAAGALGAPPSHGGADDAAGEEEEEEEEEGGTALPPLMGTYPHVLGRTSECPPEATVGFGDTQLLIDATASLASGQGGAAARGRAGSDDGEAARVAAQRIAEAL
jgi:hypothetical protein